MKPRRPRSLRQPTSPELRDACLEFLRRKFYGTSPEEVKAFNQDRKALLRMVVLWPAAWLDKRSVTIHGDSYREIFMKVFMQAAAHMQSKVRYRPAYLAQVIQSHFAIHGEEYYEEAKSVRTLADQALVLVGKIPVAQAPDPIREMAAAARLLSQGKRKVKPAIKGPVNLELKLA